MSETKASVANESLEAVEAPKVSDKKCPWFAKPKVAEVSKVSAAIAEDSLDYPDDTTGLAISGGGIRSATFALGILQSMARADWLKHVDLLSTVSGGGYVGTFLGRYFDQLRHAHTPNAHGKSAAQRIVAATLQDSQSPEIRWLRQQSNYLAPTGTGEALFNIATFWRNFLSLHFVLGMLFVGIFGAMNAITYGHLLLSADSSQGSIASILAPVTTAINSDALSASVAEYGSYAAAGRISSVAAWWVFAEMLVWLVLLPQVMAYWLVSQDRNESIVITVLASFLLLAVAASIASGVALPIIVFAASVFWMVVAWHNIRRQIGSSNPSSSYALTLARNRLTQNLAWSTASFGVVLALGVINVLGSYLSHYFFAHDELTGTRVLTQLGYLAAPFIAAAPLLRALATFVANREDHPRSFLNTLAKIPYLMNTIMVLIGTVLPLSVVAFLSHASYGNGDSYYVGIGVTALTLVVSLILGHREALQFVNRSGPFSIYAARLARVFLGAVNPVRQRQSRGGDVTTVILGDDVVHDNYKPHVAGGPLHLFNVTVNETVDVVSQRGLRDRQGENMAVGPAGLSISREWHSLWEKETNDSNGILVKPLVNGPRVHPLVAKDGGQVFVERLSIRQWMAISGAAISSGAGRYTGAAFSLLVTLANLRLGYWWDSGLWAGKRAHLPILDTKFEFVKRLCYRFLAAQSLLVSELRGRFGGPWRRHFYLSDGGHFENSGVYELLRRRVPYIIAIDGGQDRLQQGTGLGELQRIARIDFGCEFEEVSSDPTIPFTDMPPSARNILGSMDDLLAVHGSPNAKRHATLLRVRYPVGSAKTGWHSRTESWILYIRLTMTGDEPADLMNYRATHPDFPNQTTLDQDFDEPQFESYRRLGQHIGDQLFL